ncbi:MAG: FAD-dependent oxidoreductase, partial [Actinomycetia bacterium]|nr:FAD-dependent oxidoreductase [Actinomycetes bacterium]
MFHVKQSDEYEVVIVGAGFAGYEAANASAKIGCKTALVTRNIDEIASIPCSTTFGGSGRWQLVKEIDGLGGITGKAIESSYILKRKLNIRKGIALGNYLAIVDKEGFKESIYKDIIKQTNITLKQGSVEKLNKRKNKIEIMLSSGEKVTGKTVVLCLGTFLNGEIAIGDKRIKGGRKGELAPDRIKTLLKDCKVKTGRFRTGTGPKIDIRTINAARLEKIKGEENNASFSFWIKKRVKEEGFYYRTKTNKDTEKVIEECLKRKLKVKDKKKGPRYCPSIETKTIEYKGKAHTIFIQPENITGIEWSLQGLATSIEENMQQKLVQSL